MNAEKMNHVLKCQVHLLCIGVFAVVFGNALSARTGPYYHLSRLFVQVSK